MTNLVFGKLGVVHVLVPVLLDTALGASGEGLEVHTVSAWVAIFARVDCYEPWQSQPSCCPRLASA